MDNLKEILFWKVFHNKPLRNLIFYHIQITEWVEYTDPIQIKPNNRLKFKEITSLKFLLMNKLYKLLKCKLEHDEYIEIGVKSVSLLFEKIENSTTTESITESKTTTTVIEEE